MRLQPFLRSSLQFAYQTHIQTKALRKFSPQLYWCTTYFHRCDTRFVLVISYIFNFVEFICIHTHKKANFSRRFCLCYCLKNCAKTKYVRRLYKKSYACAVYCAYERFQKSKTVNMLYWIECLILCPCFRSFNGISIEEMVWLHTQNYHFFQAA